MSDVRPTDRVIAVCCSDLHLSDSPPIFRSAEPCWYSAMERQLGELGRLAQCFGGVPILYAGDLFHKWNPSPKLINFALRHLPHGYAVPGQHDLRHHSMESLADTAYWTLFQCGKITHLHHGACHAVGQCVLWGFPWGSELTPRPPHAVLEGLHVAVIHQYVWTKKCSYPGAPEDTRLGEVRKRLAGYDVAVFGDNHLGFTSHEEGGCTVCNCGCFYRRNSDQKDYRPAAGLILGSGKVRTHYFDVSEDVCLSDQRVKGPDLERGFDDFVEDLSSLGGQTTDYREMVYRECERRKCPEEVTACVRKALGD